MTTAFEDLNLQPELLQAVVELGYVEPMPIQSVVIPRMLAGQDIVGQAQTGTGKTAAFALPMLQNLLNGHSSVQGLVLAPTRELALQVTQAFRDFGRGKMCASWQFTVGSHTVRRSPPSSRVWILSSAHPVA